MIIKIPVSLGELIDKITILSIKLEKITSPEKNKLIKKEYEELYISLKDAISDNNISEIEEYIKNLKDINHSLWVIEDSIRECERKKTYDKDFIDLARSVYITNDKRSKIKNEINLKFSSEIIEVKSYKDY